MSDGNDIDGYRLYTIRPPLIEDADELGRMHVQAWREAYADLMSQETLAALDPVRRGSRWRAIAAEEAEGIAEASGKTTRVAVDAESGALVGFCTVAAPRDDHPPVPTELWAINILADHYGRGAAGQLLAGALGDRAAYLWVVDGNERAQAFYRKHGFTLDGGQKRDEELDVLELRMVRG